MIGLIKRKEILKILDDYDLDNAVVGVLGSHSALDVCDGAKDEGFPTLAVCQKGRDETYSKYFRTRRVNGLEKGVVDECMTLPKFKDIMKAQVQKELRGDNVLFVPNRSFVVYAGIDNVEDKFRVPLIGSRDMLRMEDRDREEKNYYWVCERAGIPAPRKYEDPEDIDTLVMVKPHHAKMPLERGFFTATNYKEYREKAERLIKRGVITRKILEDARIEQYVIGPVFNFNFFYSPIDDEVELCAIDWRFESNLDGMVRIPAAQQMELPDSIKEPLMVIVGHSTATLRESLLEKVYPLAEKFVQFAKKEYGRGIIGPFCLQTIVDKDMNFWTYDIATRIGGGTNIHMNMGHPYSNTLLGDNMSSGRRLALEIRRAIDLGKIDKIVT